MFKFLVPTSWRRKRVLSQPFPEHWEGLLAQQAIYSALTTQEQAQLKDLIKIFLDEKSIEGCAGLEITDEIRITIAAHACVLLLGRETDIYPKCATILVYPDAYIAKGTAMGPGGVLIETTQVRSGESWQGAFAPQSGGPVVLSWRAVKRSAHCPLDGSNVVFHEFAHQLDSEAGGMDGAPRLEREGQYLPWARVLGSEYQSLANSIRNGQPTFINPYGATNPAEFFAVCTELFFERGREMKARHPELYQQLADFYKQDPASREMCGK